MDKIQEIKMILREKDYQFFEDDEINYYLAKYEYNIRETVYNLLLIKAENDATSIDGLATESSKDYWLRLAKKYRPIKTRVL